MCRSVKENCHCVGQSKRTVSVSGQSNSMGSVSVSVLLVCQSVKDTNQCVSQSSVSVLVSQGVWSVCSSIEEYSQFVCQSVKDNDQCASQLKSSVSQLIVSHTREES